LSNILKKIGINKRTLKEILLSEIENNIEFKDDPKRLTTIAITVETKMRLCKFMNKNDTYDKGLRRILDILEKNFDKIL